MKKLPKHSRHGFQLLFWAACVVASFPLGLVAQRNLKDIPDPDPEVERKSFIVADGFEVNLFAADPQIAKPIQMNFDARGRLWIASSEVYPHIKPGQKANDKILVIEDLDGDGRADKTTVFADGLLIPTGVVPGDGGVYVANSTELLHFVDTDGDGKADSRRIVLSGFGTEDTHHLLHTLRWGHDGMLYMNQSIYIHSHIETPYGVRHLNGGGIWQFRPETMQLEVFCKGFVNSWGHHFDRWGQSFATDGAYGDGINYVFPGSVFVTSPGAKRWMRGLNQGSPKHCGLEIVSGRHLPPDWQGNMITNDFRAHRVCRFVVTEDGSGYASRQEVELIKTKHVAFRPIDVKMGPDGAIYIADWYNPIIQHGEVDFRDPRRDHVHGRIWRVTAKGRPTLKPPKLVDATTEELLEQIKAPEEWTRLWAKLILKSHGAKAVVPALKKWLGTLDKNHPDFEHHRLEALWLFQAIRKPEPRLLHALLESSDHRARAAAVRVAIHWRDDMREIVPVLERAVKDKHPRVRLEGVRALARLNSAHAAELALLVLDQPMDRFLDFALWKAMRELQSFWLPAVRGGRLALGGNAEHLTFALRAVDSPAVVQPLLKLIAEDMIPADRVDSVLAVVASLGGAGELGKVLDSALAGNPNSSRAARLLNSLVETTQQRRLRPSGDLNRLKTLFDSENEAVRAAAVRAAGTWQVATLRQRVADWAVSKDDKSSAVRQAAFEALAGFGDAASRKVLVVAAGSDLPFPERAKAIVALASLDVDTACHAAVDALVKQQMPDGAAALVASLLKFRASAKSLTTALKDQALEADIAKSCIRAVRSAPQSSPDLIAAFRTAGRLEDSGWKLTPQLLEQLITEVNTKGDPHRGEAVYRRKEFQCMNCHAIGGAGGRVGPDLISIGASAQVDYLIESLIEPNKKIKENFHSTIVATDQGKVFTGIPIRKAGGILVLRDAEDREVRIPLDSIEAQRDGRSLMADGLADPLTRVELVDLVRFLSELGKVGDFSISKQRIVRRWRALVWTQEGHRRLNRTSYDTAATDDPALTWMPAYSRVSGDLPIGQLPKFVTHRNNPPTTFLRFDVDVTTPGKVTMALGNIKGVRFWLDSQPTPLDELTELELSLGRRTFSFSVDRTARSSLRVVLDDAKDSQASWQVVSGK